ncbi:MAG: NAD(+)/NADH kinase [Thermomicrobiales bacterium]
MPIPPSSIAVIPAHDKSESHELFESMQGWFLDTEIELVTEDQLNDGASPDALIALGGDGLMMRMGRAYPGIPILGINFGTVGFLAMAERSQWRDVLESLAAGEFHYQDGPTLRVDVTRGDRLLASGTAINDVVIRSGLRMIDTELYVDRMYVNTYPGDGMIVATPQGSTAYCMAAGGPILIAGVHGFALTPLSPHSPIRSTFVVPEESRIEMVVANERVASLILDGEELAEIGQGDLVQVDRNNHPFRMIHLEGMNFYEAFRSKFNYLIRPDATPSLGSYRRSS